MSKSTWSKGRLSVRLSHVCETDCNRFLLDKESTVCTDRCNRTKIPEHANSASSPAWEADVLLNYEHLFFVQKVDGEERFPLLFSVQREGAAGETQTCGILPKRQMLYPIALRADKRRQRHESSPQDKWIGAPLGGRFSNLHCALTVSRDGCFPVICRGNSVIQPSRAAYVQ